MNFSKTTITKNKFVVKAAATNKETVLVEIVGKKRALQAAGLPTNLAPATPQESRWGKVVTIDEAKKILSL